MMLQTTNSASQVDIVTIGFLFEDRVNAVLPRKNENPRCTFAIIGISGPITIAIANKLEVIG